MYLISHISLTSTEVHVLSSNEHLCIFVIFMWLE